MHEKNFIHRDLSFGNLCISPNTQIKGCKTGIFLIDFGLAKRFVNPRTGEHNQRRMRTVVGSPTFVSIDGHKGYDHARKDDLEALFYVLVRMFKGVLPWESAKKPEILNINELPLD